MSAYLDLAREAGGRDAAIEVFLAASTTALERPEADIADYEAFTRQGHEAIAALEEAYGSVEIERLILSRSEAIIGQ